VTNQGGWIIPGEQSLYWTRIVTTSAVRRALKIKTLTGALRLESAGRLLTSTGLVFVVKDSAAEPPSRGMVFDVTSFGPTSCGFWS